jgi:tripartite-type tricarboxylate transporter receptor subunit TctC
MNTDCVTQFAAASSRRVTGSLLRLLLISFAAGLFAAADAHAQAWPTKQPIRVIVPLSAGSAIDIVARIFFEQISRQIGQTIVIENRTGASQAIGAGMVAKADPDGYTVLVSGSGLSVIPATMSNLNFSVANDLTRVASLANLPLAMVVSPSKYQTINDFVSAAKAKPGSITYGSAGRGDSTHLAAERFRMSAGFEGLYVPFRGAPEVLTEVMAERLDFYFAPLAPAMPMITSGKLQPLVVASAKRSVALPNVPTTTEAAFANSDYEFWVGSYVPTGTPREIVERLHQEITKAMDMPEVQNRLKSVGGQPARMTTPEFDAQFRKELDMNAALVQAVGIQRN